MIFHKNDGAADGTFDESGMDDSPKLKVYENEPAVRIENVSKTYTTQQGEEVVALKDINLTIDRGDFICVVGPSGCGKTTLLNMLAGYEKPTKGWVQANAKQIDGPDPQRGVVFQKPTLYPWLTVKGNVEFGLRMQGKPKKERSEIADRFLELVGLADAGARRPYELSGGMQQRCQIARVLATDPALIMMDEPYGALDALTRENLQNELLRIWRERKKTVFFITHSVDEAVFLATRVIVMSKHPGTVVMDVPVDIASTLPDGVEPTPENIRSAPEFVRLCTMITNKIYEQGM